MREGPEESGVGKGVQDSTIGVVNNAVTYDYVVLQAAESQPSFGPAPEAVG